MPSLKLRKKIRHLKKAEESYRQNSVEKSMSKRSSYPFLLTPLLKVDVWAKIHASMSKQKKKTKCLHQIVNNCKVCRLQCSKLQQSLEEA